MKFIFSHIITKLCTLKIVHKRNCKSIKGAFIDGVEERDFGIFITDCRYFYV